MSSSPITPPSDWLQALARYRKESAYALFGAAAVAAGVGLYLGWKVFHWSESPAVWLWCFALALVGLGAGLVQLLRQPTGQLSESEYSRLVVLIAGGLVGLATAALGVGLIWQWWQTVSGGWSAWRGEEGWRIWVILLALVSGLAVMFASLQMARTETRTSALLRRLLYGYNAVLTGLLLLGILLVLNVLTYLPNQPFGKTYDWTSQSIYSLSPLSENVLKSLDRPVKVYVILRPFDEDHPELYRQVRALLENCQAYTPYLEVEYLSPDRNVDRIIELAREYKFGDQSEGLLAVYGKGSDAQSQFLRISDLTDISFNPGARRRTFNGESALISAINFMKENKKKPVIYFTQGNGEPSIRDSSRRGGLGRLRQRLEDRSFYEVKGLELTAEEKPRSADPGTVVAKEVPEGADAVIVVQPTEELPSAVRNALREYVKKKGRLVVLLGLLRRPDSPAEMRHTGLEELLAEFDVKVGDDVVLHVPTEADPSRPQFVLVQTNPDEALQNRIPLAGAFQGLRFQLQLPRSVQPAPGRPGSPYAVDTLLEVPYSPGRYLPLLQSNLLQVGDAAVLELLQTGQIEKKISTKSVPVAVTVSEDESGAPADEVHARLRGGKQRPALVVFGDYEWATNLYVEGSRGGFYDLFASSLAWLRERPTSIGIPPKKSDVFTWKPDTNVSRMVWLPFFLSIFGIVGLGTGIWVIRRR